jgi:WD40 repeat protein
MPSSLISTANIADVRELARFGKPLIYEIKLAADGKTAYAACSDAIRAFEIATGNLISTIPVFFSRGWQESLLDISGDGSRFSLLSERGVEVFDIAGNLLLELDIDSEWHTADLSPDGRFLAFTYGDDFSYPFFKVIRIEDQSLQHEGRGSKPQFTPDGSRLITLTSTQVVLWSTATWQQEGSISYLAPRIRTTFSNDGKYLAISKKDEVEIWQIDERSRVARLVNLYPQPYSTPQVLFSFDGLKVATLDGKQEIVVWDILTGKVIGRQSSKLWELWWVVLENDGIVRFLDIPIPDSPFQTPPYANFPAMGFDTADERLWVLNKYYTDDEINFTDFFQACDLNLTGASHCSQTAVNTAAVSDSSGEMYILVPSESKGPGWLDLRSGLDGSGATLMTISTAGQEVRPYYLSRDHRYLVYAQGNAVIAAWDEVEKRIVQSWSGSLRSLFYSEDEKHLLLHFVIRSGSSGPTDGYRLVVVGMEPLVTRYQQTFSTSLEEAFVFTADGGQLLYLEDDFRSTNQEKITVSVHSLDLQTYQPRLLFQFSDQELPVIRESYWMGGAAAVSPDGSLLVLGFGEGNLLAFDLANGQHLSTWRAHGTGIDSLLFSHRGSLLASASADGFIKIWGVP